MFKRALEEGLRFSCTSCSQCCTGSPGYVWLSPSDIEGLSRHFSLDRDAFLLQYCSRIRVGEGFGYSLREKSGNDCIFLYNGKCEVYEARPVQCRTYPFWDSILESESTWNSESAFCPGIEKGIVKSPEEITFALLESRKNARLACARNNEDWRENA